MSTLFSKFVCALIVGGVAAISYAESNAVAPTAAKVDCCAVQAACCPGPCCDATAKIEPRATAAADCCFPGADCCVAELPCCEGAAKSVVKTAAKSVKLAKGDCCFDGAECCTLGLPCCTASPSCCETGATCCAEAATCCVAEKNASALPSLKSVVSTPTAAKCCAK